MSQQSHRERHRPSQVSLDDLPERFAFSVADARQELAIQIGVVVRAKHECSAPLLLRRRRVRIPHLNLWSTGRATEGVRLRGPNRLSARAMAEYPFRRKWVVAWLGATAAG